jgi:hypothetical protein
VVFNNPHDGKKHLTLARVRLPEIGQDQSIVFYRAVNLGGRGQLPYRFLNIQLAPIQISINRTFDFGHQTATDIGVGSECEILFGSVARQA